MSFVYFSGCDIKTVANDDISENIERIDTLTTDENILAYWNFEGDDPLHNLSSQNMDFIRKDPVDPSNTVMYSELVPGTGVYRNEVKWMETDTYNHYFFTNTDDSKTGDDFWIGFKVYFPKLKSYVEPQHNPSIFQIGPMSRKEDFEGSVGFYQLQALTHWNRWRWRKFNVPNYTPGDITEHPTILNYNQWENFVIHCRMRDNDEGLIEIWKNGEKVYTRNGANAVQGTRTVIQWGVYIGIGSSTKDLLSCYYDEIKIGNSLSGYDAVAPK